MGDLAAGFGPGFFLVTAERMRATADLAAAFILATGLAPARAGFVTDFAAGAFFFGSEELVLVFIRAGPRSDSGFGTQLNTARLGRQSRWRNVKP